MKIDTMRRWDRYAGVPLCFLVTMITRLKDLLSGARKKEDPPSRVLFIKLSEMGAIITAYPLMKKIAETCPSAELFFLTFADNKEIFPFLDTVPPANVFTIRSDSFLLFLPRAASAREMTRETR